MPGENLGDSIIGLHAEIRRTCPKLCRVSVAVYDPATDMLKTFVDSTEGTPPLLSFYEARLSDVPSLKRLAETGEARTIEDLDALADSGTRHSRRIREAGYRSSYTVPFYHGKRLLGFLFFDSDAADYFRQPVTVQLSVYARLISSMLASELLPISTLKGAVSTARAFSRFRDEETAGHLARMAGYAQVVARALAPERGLSEEYVEFLYQFAPLHDVGKVAVPDRILLKPGPLDAGEVAVMRSHVPKGLAMVDVMIEAFDLGSVLHVEMLRNIIGFHHENWDGTGYPGGLAAEAIPLEARIVRVADAFDALTSRRPYKPAWPVDEALDYLDAQAGSHFDPDCVRALAHHHDRIDDLHRRFAEDVL